MSIEKIKRWLEQVIYWLKIICSIGNDFNGVTK